MCVHVRGCVLLQPGPEGIHQARRPAHAHADMEPHQSLQIMLKRVSNLNQGRNESNVNYYKRCKALFEVFVWKWGDNFFPKKLANGTASADQEKTRQEFISRIFLAGADKSRYGAYQEELHNKFMMRKNNEYPMTLEDCLKALNGRKSAGGSGARSKASGHDEGTTASSFAQQGRRPDRRGCFICGDLDHKKVDCPQNRANQNQQQQHNQIVVDEDQDEEDEPARAPPRRRNRAPDIFRG